MFLKLNQGEFVKLKLFNWMFCDLKMILKTTFVHKKYTRSSEYNGSLRKNCS